MRNLKFRVWNVFEKRFIDVLSIDFNRVHVAQGYQHYLVNNPDYEPEFTIQQFTGKYDKDNKMIYEGDVLKGPIKGEEYIVEYDELQAAFIAKTSNGVNTLPTAYWDRKMVITNVNWKAINTDE